MPQGSDEVLFIALIFGIAIFILIILLAGVVLIHHYEHRRNEKLTLSSLIGTITDFSKANPKIERMPSRLTSSGITSVSEPKHNIELESVEIAKTARVPKGIKALNWRGCFAMLFVLVVLGSVITWLLQPYLLPYVAFFLRYFGICCP